MSYIHTNPVYQASPYGMASLAPIAWTGQRRVRCNRALPRETRNRRPRYLTLGLTSTTPGGQEIEKGVSTGVTVAAPLALTAIGAGAAAGPIGMAIGAAVGMIASLISGHHAGALQKEAGSLSQAMPAFLQQLEATMDALNSGQISASAAISALQGAQSSYYAAVSGIIKKSGSCRTAANGLDPGATDKYGCSTTSDPCNAACCIGCNIVEPAVRNLTAIIQAGGGSYTTVPLSVNKDNPAIGTAPAVTFSYNGSQGVGVTSGGGTLFGLPSIDVYGGGALLLLLILMMR